jgi:hypothetical protein
MMVPRFQIAIPVGVFAVHTLVVVVRVVSLAVSADVTRGIGKVIGCVCLGLVGGTEQDEQSNEYPTSGAADQQAEHQQQQ